MHGQLIPAYILHSRAFAEDKLILQLLLPELGRLSAVVRKKTGKQRLALQPFQQYSVQLVGRADLKTVRSIDELAPAFSYSGKLLFSAMYLNELICRLWPDNLAAEQLFALYHRSLCELATLEADAQALEPCLRQFEFALLAELGVAVDWTADAEGAPIIAAGSYQWQADVGFVLSSKGWSGEQLLQIATGQWQLSDTRRCAKQLSRQLLAPLLGDKPLLSRALFSAGT